MTPDGRPARRSSVRDLRVWANNSPSVCKTVLSWLPKAVRDNLDIIRNQE